MALSFPSVVNSSVAAISPMVSRSRRRVVSCALAAGIAAIIAGCAGPGRIAGDGAAFERSGRFAVNVTDAAAAPEAVQGGFAWRDTGRVLMLDLVNPLGSTLARIQVDARGATLERTDGSTETAPDADALVAQVLGTPLPVSSLRDWLQGRAGEGAVSNMERDAQGRPESFTQEGWQLRFSRYDALGPGLLRLDRRDGSRRISVRLAIDTQAG